MAEKQRMDTHTMALRAAREFQDGMVINLGGGLPLLAANFILPGREIIFHTENGALGYGEMSAPGEGDPNLINAFGQTMTPQPGMSFFEQAESFCMIRGGHLDCCVLGGLQVSEKGDLANWVVPGRQIVGAVGGAMDLACGARMLIILMTHNTREGEPKILKECSYPVTARECVDLIVTDIAVIEVTQGGLVLKEMAPGWTPGEIQALTEPTLNPAPDLQDIQLM